MMGSSPQLVSTAKPAALVPRLVALVLLFAAIAKAYQPWHLMRGAGPLLVQVAMELLLAFWLFSGAASRWAVRTALAVFALLAAVSLLDVYTQKKSCGCFGVLQVPPVATFLLDLTIVSALSLMGSNQVVMDRSLPKRLLRSTAILVVGIAALIAVRHRHAQQPPPSTAALARPSTESSVH